MIINVYSHQKQSGKNHLLKKNVIKLLENQGEYSPNTFTAQNSGKFSKEVFGQIWYHTEFAKNSDNAAQTLKKNRSLD